MKKTYRSKIELALFIPVIMVSCLTGILFAINHFWAGSVLAAAVVAFIAYLCIDTFYELTADMKLRVRSGFFFNQVIYVNSIKKIRCTKNTQASPALSADRLQIFYNRYGVLMISPREQQNFINELTKINPRIEITD